MWLVLIWLCLWDTLRSLATLGAAGQTLRDLRKLRADAGIDILVVWDRKMLGESDDSARQLKKARLTLDVSDLHNGNYESILVIEHPTTYEVHAT